MYAPILSATLLSADLQDVVLADVSAVVDRFQYTDRMGEGRGLRLDVVHAGVAGTDAFQARRVLRVTREGGEVELWRTDRVRRQTSGQADMAVDLVPLAEGLADAAARFTSGAVGDAQVFLTGRTLPDALAQILDPANGAPARSDGSALFVVGTVAAGLTGALADVQASAATTLDLLDLLAQQAECAWRDRVEPGAAGDGSDDQIAIDLVELVDPSDAGAATFTVTNDGADDALNATDLALVEDTSDAYSAVVPVATTVDPPVTAAGAVWPVVVDGSAPAGQKRVRFELPEAELGLVPSTLGPVTADSALVGRALKDVVTGTVYPIAASAAPDVVFVEDPSGTFPAQGEARITTDSGAALMGVEHPQLVYAYGRKERYEGLPVSPYAERLSVAGVSVDLSSWDAVGPEGGPFPVGFYGDSNPLALPAITASEATAPGDVGNGTKSARFVVPGDRSVVVGTGTAGDGPLGRPWTDPHLSLWAAYRLEAGTVELVLDNAYRTSGTYREIARYRLSATPEGTSTFNEVRVELSAEALQGHRPEELRARFLAVGQATFVLDAVTAVNATTAQPYAPLPGPRGLWFAAVRSLHEHALYGATSWTGQALDTASLGITPDTPVRAGDLVAVHTEGPAAASSGTAYVVEARWEERVGSPRELVEFELGRPPTNTGYSAGGSGPVGSQNLWARTSGAYTSGRTGGGTAARTGTTSDDGTLSDGVPQSRTVTGSGTNGFALTGGGDLSADRVLTVTPPQDLRTTATPQFARVSLSNQATTTTHAVRADRKINNSASNLGFQITGLGDLTSDRTPVLTVPQDLRTTATPTFGSGSANGHVATLARFGAETASGTSQELDWNHVDNTRPGTGRRLLKGNHPNGPSGADAYFHAFNFEFSSKSGTGNLTQLALPYSGGATEGLWLRTRYSGSWTGWDKIWTSATDGAGSGLDADLWDGNDFAAWLNQPVRTTDAPQFSRLGVGRPATGYSIDATSSILSDGDFISKSGGGSAFQVWRPDTTGGWARGFVQYTKTGTAREAGFGFLGTGDAAAYQMSLGFGSAWWSGGTGVHLRNDGNFRMGVATDSPAYTLDVSGTARITGWTQLQGVLDVTGAATFDGGVIVDTSTNTVGKRFAVTRLGGLDQSLQIGVEDSVARFYSVQDETVYYGGYRFDQVSGDGAVRTPINVDADVSDPYIHLGFGGADWKVAINTVAAPAYTLDVAGTFGVSGAATVAGGITSTRGTATNGVGHVYLRAAGLGDRWVFGLQGTEADGNAGSDLRLWRYSNTGTYLDTALIVERATGKVTVNGAVQAQSTLAVTGAATFGSDVGTADFVSQLTGWRVTEPGAADFRSVYADSLYVRTFTADVAQALAGSDYLTKSVAVLAADVVLPAATGVPFPVIVEELPGLPGLPPYENGDTLRFRLVDRSGGGLVVGDAWGRLLGAMVDNGDGTWGQEAELLAADAGVFSQTIYSGAVVLDYGTPGDSLIVRTVADQVAGGGYDRIVTWHDTNAGGAVQTSGVPYRYEVVSQLGALDGLTDPTLGALSGAGLYTHRGYLVDGPSYLRFGDGVFELVLDGTDIGAATYNVTTALANNGITSSTNLTQRVDTVGARTVLTTDTNGNVSSLSLESGVAGSAIKIKADQIAVEGLTTFVSGVTNSAPENLVLNGFGTLSDPLDPTDPPNWTGWTFDPSQGVAGSGSFRAVGENLTRFADELLPVDTTRTYRLALNAKELGAAGARQYFGFAPYDIAGDAIMPWHWLHVGGTETTLVNPPSRPSGPALQAGDTEVHLASATGWHNGATSHMRSFQFYGTGPGEGYTGTTGFVYEPYGYTRDVIYNGAWAQGGISGNVVTLSAPYSGPDRASGTAVANGQSGSNYIYGVSNVTVPTEWTTYEMTIGPGGDLDYWPGTAQLKLLFLINRNSTSGGADGGDLAVNAVHFGLHRPRWDELGALAPLDLIETAQLGSTVISGGYIKTELIDAQTIITTNDLATNQDVSVAITAFDQGLGGLAYASEVGLTDLNATIVSGGKIRTDLLLAGEIVSQKVSVVSGSNSLRLNPSTTNAITAGPGLGVNDHLTHPFRVTYDGVVTFSKGVVGPYKVGTDGIYAGKDGDGYDPVNANDVRSGDGFILDTDASGFGRFEVYDAGTLKARVDTSGLYAVDADISGTVTATDGAIGPLSVSAERLTVSNGTGDLDVQIGQIATGLGTQYGTQKRGIRFWDQTANNGAGEEVGYIRDKTSPGAEMEIYTRNSLTTGYTKINAGSIEFAADPTDPTGGTIVFTGGMGQDGGGAYFEVMITPVATGIPTGGKVYLA